MNNLIKKGTAVAVIFLFISLAFAPSINATVNKAPQEDKLVEFTTEVCGLNGGKHTVQLTQKEAEEVEALFDSIRDRFNASETREETEEIFEEAVIELDNYGLLGGLSVKQAQRLVTGRYKISRLNGLIEKKLMNNPWIPPEDIFNTKCFVVSRVIGDGTWDVTLAQFIFCAFFVALGLSPPLF